MEWLGDVPEHWQIVRTKDIFNHRKEEALEDDEIVTAFRDGQVTLRKNRRTDGFTNSIKEHGYQHINSGDLVIHEMDAFAGAIGVSDSSGKSTPVYTVCYSKNKNINHHFYSHFFRTMAKTGFINSLAKGIRVRSTEFRWNESRNVYLALPPKADQQKIVSFLDTETARIDNLIAKQEKLIELLEEQRKSIISHAVTKGLNPNAPMKDSGVEWLGDVPEHWNLKPIKFLAKTNQLTLAENTDENYEIQYVDIGSVSRTNGIEKIETILFKDAPSRARRIVKDGDIIVSTVRTYLKAIAYIENPPKNLIVSTGFAVLNPIRTVIFPQYAKFTFLAEQFIAEVIAKSKGISYPAITATELADIKIALPPLNEQKVILQYLLEENLKMNKLISKQNQLIEKLKEYRASIISHAVTGKIDVREFGA